MSWRHGTFGKWISHGIVVTIATRSSQVRMDEYPSHRRPGGSYRYCRWDNSWTVREGDLIGFRTQKTGGIARHELRNLADPDPEVKNYATEHPKIVNRLITC